MVGWARDKGLRRPPRRWCTMSGFRDTEGVKWLALADGLVWVVRMKEMIRMTVFSLCHFSNGGGCHSLMWNFRRGGQWVLASGAGRKP